MSDVLTAALKVAGAGIEAQSVRMRIVSENLANANSTGPTPGSDPYQRKTVSFVSELDRQLGASTIRLDRIERDKSDFPTVYDPEHIAANEAGLVKMPNVNVMLELADMRETVRGYQANVRMASQIREMISTTIDMMRS